MQTCISINFFCDASVNCWEYLQISRTAATAAGYLIEQQVGQSEQEQMIHMRCPELGKEGQLGDSVTR